MKTFETITREETKGAKLSQVVLYAFGKMLDHKDSHIEIHTPQTGNMMEFVTMVGRDSEGGYFTYYRSFYTTDEGETRFCDSTREHFDYASELSNALIADGTDGCDWDTIEIIEGNAPACTHP